MNLELTTLKNPTVSDLIEFLSTLPGDMSVLIDDADTSWEFDTIHVSTNDRDSLLLYGDYLDLRRTQL